MVRLAPSFLQVQLPQVRLPAVPIFRGNFYVAEVIQQLCCLEESGQQRLNNVYQTHLVLANGKLVLGKKKELKNILVLYMVSPSVRVYTVPFITIVKIKSYQKKISGMPRIEHVRSC